MFYWDNLYVWGVRKEDNKRTNKTANIATAPTAMLLLDNSWADLGGGAEAKYNGKVRSWNGKES